MNNVAAPLPPFYAISAPLRADGSVKPLFEQSACRAWLAAFGRLVAGDISLVQLRAKDLDPGELDALARRCKEIAAGHGVKLLLNGPAALARSLGLDGIHLTSNALFRLAERPLPENYLVGASCHSPQELSHAERINADFACLSPVKPVKAYGEAECLGLDTFAEWVSRCRLPIYGLGGLQRGDLDEIRQAGGCGVAGISAFWSRTITS